MTQFRPSPAVVGAVAVGGALGAVMRWWLGVLVPDGAGVPWTTFAINLAGSFLLGLLVEVGPLIGHHVLIAGLGPGLLGGFTTLSAYAEQARSLASQGLVGLAGAYLAGSVLACVGGVALARAGWARPDPAVLAEVDHG